MTEYEKRSLHFMNSIDNTLKELVAETKKLQGQLAAAQAAKAASARPAALELRR